MRVYTREFACVAVEAGGGCECACVRGGAGIHVGVGVSARASGSASTRDRGRSTSYLCGMSTSVQLAIAHRPESGSEPAVAPQPRAGHRSRATAATVKVEIFSAAARWVLR